MKFAERFATERKNKKMSVEDAAAACKISRSYVVLIESGKRRPGTKIIPKIAEAFGLPVNVILNWYLEDMRGRLEEKLGK